MPCTKVPYRTELDARISLALFRRKGERRPKTERSVYFCRSCRRWHLTSMQRMS